MSEPNVEYALDTAKFVPVSLWGRDHWSMLLYFRSVEVDHGGFEVKFNPRMRQNRRNFRVLPGEKLNGLAMQPENGSRLNDRTFIIGHDDWCCLQDFANAKVLTCDPYFEPCDKLHLSKVGELLVLALESHKARGGSFANFKLAGIGTLTLEVVRDGKTVESVTTLNPVVENGIAGVIP